MKFQPAIKWSGSKRSQSENIVSKIKDKDYDTYYEPFVGGASVLYQLLKSDKKFQRYVCSDINGDLITLWNKIKTNPVDIAMSYETMWNELNADDNKQRKKEYFSTVRRRFNEHKNPNDFMFIMRTTTNGMPRYNSSGNFNNSFHVTRDGINPKKLSNIIADWSTLLNENDVQFINQSYDAVESSEDDFLYLDPPYANTKGMYYGAIDYQMFWDWLKKQKGDYFLSFNGKTSANDMTVSVPTEIYSEHEYLYSGNSSFRRVVGISSKEYVHESLYIK